MNAIFKRVSVRSYAEKPVEDEKVEKILRAGMAAPSGGNQQPWHFVVVDDPTLLEELSKSSKVSGRTPDEISVQSWRKFARIINKALKDDMFANRLTPGNHECRLAEEIYLEVNKV